MISIQGILYLGWRCNSVGELHQEKHPVSNQNVAPLLWSREQQKQLYSIKMAVPSIFVVASATLKKFFMPYLEQNSITDRNLGESYVTFGRCANNVSWTFNKANREQNISRWRGDDVRLGTDIINIHKLQSYSRMFWFVLARQLQILSQRLCLLSDNPNSCSQGHRAHYHHSRYFNTQAGKTKWSNSAKLSREKQKEYFTVEFLPEYKNSELFLWYI